MNMTTSISQAVSIATRSTSMGVQSAAFYALDKSDVLNNLTSRITGGSINRYTLAQSVIHHATELALEIPYCRSQIQKLADSHFGTGAVNGVDFARSVMNVLRETNETKINEGLSQILIPILQKQSMARTIPWATIEPTINLSQGLFTNHIGPRSPERFLATYIKAYGWNVVDQHIQTAAQGRNSVFQAGVGWMASFVQGLIDRGIVENREFQNNLYPEHRLVAGCLHAYLSNRADCLTAIDAYTPSTALFNTRSIRDITTLAIQFLTHRTAQARKNADTSARDLSIAGQQLGAAEKAVKAAENHSSDAQADASSNFALRNTVFVSVLNQDTQIKQTYQKARTALDTVCAAKDLLVDDPERNADERIKEAIRSLLNVALKSQGTPIDESGYVATGLRYAIDTAIAPALGNTLQTDNHLPVQNIIGTYAAEHDPDLSRLQYYLSAQLNLALADRAARNNTTVSWFEEEASRVTVKLAIAHLNLYIRDGDFNQSESPEYRLIADVIEKVIAEDESYTDTIHAYLHGIARRQSGNNVALQNVGAIATAAAMGLGGAAYSVANSVTKTSRHYRPLVTGGINDLVTQLNEVGIAKMLKNSTIRVGTTIPGYVSRSTTQVLSNLNTNVWNLAMLSRC